MTRDVDEAFGKDWLSFRECEPVFIDAILFAQTLFAAARVKRSDTFVKDVEPSIDKHGWIVVVECVSNFLIGIFGPARRHHLDFANFILPEFVTASQIQNVQQRAALETVASPILRVFGQYDSEQVVRRINRDVHHRAFDLFAAPDRIASQYINCFDSSFVALFKTQQQQISARHWRDVGFVERSVFATPEYLAIAAVDRVERLFRAGDHDAHFSRLVKANVVVEFCCPRLRGSGEGSEQNQE